MIKQLYTSAILSMLLSCILANPSKGQSTNVDTEQDSTLQLLADQAESLSGLTNTSLGESFLKKIKRLKSPESIPVVYYDQQSKNAVSQETYNSLNSVDKEAYSKLNLDTAFYYFTRYGTPLAYLAPLEVLGSENDLSNRTLKIADFGFGSIGHLKLLSLNDHSVTGIEIDPILKVLYQEADEVDDQLKLLYGYFPEDGDLNSELGSGYDVFISKNTLKKGYVNPPFEVDPRFSLNLGVSDSEFLETVYDILKPGGYLLIYNLHGEISLEESDYKPWTDGRSPYSKTQYEEAGFKVIAFNADHTNFARKMGEIFGWDEQMNFETDLFATYTLLRK